MINPKIDKKILSFDFDGTMAKTKELFLDSIIKFKQKYSKIHLNYDEEYVFYNSLISSGNLQGLIKELKIPVIKIIPFYKEFRNYFQSNLLSCPIEEGLDQVLENLSKEKNYTLFIISSNNKEAIQNYLEKKKLDYFEKIYSDNFSFKKCTTLKKAINNEISQNNTIKMMYIGDEIRDIHACKKCESNFSYSLPITSVSWGYQDEETLKKHNPDFLINSPKDLERLLEFIEF
jgi:phosphoglycolate phosphatase